jgi:hypothetical protein
MDINFKELEKFLIKYSGNQYFDIERFLDMASYEFRDEFELRWKDQSVEEKSEYLEQILKSGKGKIKEIGKNIDKNLNYIFTVKPLRFVLTDFIYILCVIDEIESPVPYEVVLKFEDSDDEEIFGLYKENMIKMFRNKGRIQNLRTESESIF